ncbi:MAG: hypothetical protein H8E34_11280 [Bacteroidetes bacterium]|nr:hypothetical protein [Bacteroidota bacterium]MBL6943836.1 hypothetical protein [Bacteroidales bacterium]
MKKLLVLSLAIVGFFMFSGCLNPQPKVVEEEVITEDSINIAVPDSVIILEPDSLIILEDEGEVIEE